MKLVELELWGEPGSAFIDPRIVVSVEDCAAVPADPDLDMEYIGPRVKITTSDRQIILVEGTARDVVSKLGIAAKRRARRAKSKAGPKVEA